MRARATEVSIEDWPAGSRSSLAERIAVALNDEWAAGSQGARWDQLEESEREKWREAIDVVAAVASPSLSPEQAEALLFRLGDDRTGEPAGPDDLRSARAVLEQIKDSG